MKKNKIGKFMNKKYVLLITIALIAHITNIVHTTNIDHITNQATNVINIVHITNQERAEKDCNQLPGSFFNSMQRNTGTSQTISIAIEDSEEAGHVKITVCGIKQNGPLTEEENGDTFALKTDSETVRVAYNELIRLLTVDVFKEQVIKERERQEDQVATLHHRSIQKTSLKLRSGINPDQSKTDYDKEKRELTITIPRMVEQNRGVDGDGE